MKVVSFFALSLAGCSFGCSEQQAAKPAPGAKANEMVVANAKEPDQGKRGADPDRGVWMLPKSASFSPDGKRVAVAYGPQNTGSVRFYDGPRVRFWDVETRKKINVWGWEPPPDKGPDERKPFPKFKDVDYVAFMPDGKQFLTVESDGFCRIWNADNGKLDSEFRAGWRHAAMSMDGKKLLAWKGEGIAVYELPTGKLLQERELPGRPRGFTTFPVISASADLKRLIYRSSDPDYEIYLDLERNKEIQRLQWPMPDDGRAIIFPELFSPDGKRVLARKFQGNGDDKSKGLVLCNASDLSEIQPVCKGLSPKQVTKYDIGFSPDDTKLLLRITSDPKVSGELVLWDLAKDQRIWGIRHWAETATYSPKGDRILLGHLLIDARNGSEVGELQHSYPFRVR